MAAKRKPNELVALPKKPPVDSAKVPFEMLCAWIFRSGTSFDVEEDELRVQMGPCAPTWLKGVIDAHADRLLHLAKCRRLDAHIDGRLRRLKEGVDAELHRRGVIYLTKKCDDFEKLCGNPQGYNDPGSVFAWECLEGYRETLAGMINAPKVTNSLPLGLTHKTASGW